MAKSRKKEEATHEEIVENVIGKTEEFLQKNSKRLITVFTVAVVVIVAIFGYKHLVMQPQIEEAASNIFIAEQQFNSEQWDVALNGDGNNAGFLEIIESYGSTPQAKLAAHYAGICYLNLGDLDNALTYLAKYKPVRGVPAEIINAQNFGLRGDVYVNKGDFGQAVEMYKKAVKESSNVVTTPYYLKKLGIVQEELGNKEGALEAYNRVADDFYNSLEARDIQAYIGRLQ